MKIVITSYWLTFSGILRLIALHGYCYIHSTTMKPRRTCSTRVSRSMLRRNDTWRSSIARPQKCILRRKGNSSNVDENYLESNVKDSLRNIYKAKLLIVLRFISNQLKDFTRQVRVEGRSRPSFPSIISSLLRFSIEWVLI